MCGVLNHRRSQSCDMWAGVRQCSTASLDKRRCRGSTGNRLRTTGFVINVAAWHLVSCRPEVARHSLRLLKTTTKTERVDPMAVDLAAASAVPPEQRHRKGLSYPNPLAGNPGKPKFPATVKRADGGSEVVACPVATRTMVALMDMNAVVGGAACHWGGPAALAELMSAIHGIMFSASPWHQRFNFANDAGHTENGVYALKANYGFADVTVNDLKGFRSIKSKLTGHGESHLFPDGVMVSNGPLGSSIPIAQGLAMADVLANHKRTTICVISDGAMMEGEAKEAVTAIPGLVQPVERVRQTHATHDHVLISHRRIELGVRASRCAWSPAC